MKCRIFEAILLCVLCFLLGLSVAMSLQKTEVSAPVVNVYITVSSDDLDKVKIDSEESEEILDPIPTYIKKFTEEDIINMAKMAYGESMNVPTLDSVYGERSNEYQNACSMYTVLNRVDAGYGDISTVIKARNQFIGWKNDNPVDERMYNLAKRVIEDWATGEESLRTLPADYLYFRGDGRYNHFRTRNGVEYDWSIPDPFE